MGVIFKNCKCCRSEITNDEDNNKDGGGDDNDGDSDGDVCDDGDVGDDGDGDEVGNNVDSRTYRYEFNTDDERISNDDDAAFEIDMIQHVERLEKQIQSDCAYHSRPCCCSL
jgi:hypothetical protein